MVVVGRGLAQDLEGGEDLGDRLSGFALEVGGQGVGGLGAEGEEAADGFDLVGHGFGPGGLFGRFGRGVGGGLGFGFECGGGLGGFGGLVVGAQPADVALGFFGGAFGVEGDEPVEEFFFGFCLVGGLVRQRGGGAGAAYEAVGEVVPAVGVEYGAVELVVQFT